MIIVIIIMIMIIIIKAAAMDYMTSGGNSISAVDGLLLHYGGRCQLCFYYFTSSSTATATGCPVRSQGLFIFEHDVH